MVVIFLFGIGETVYDGAIRAVVPSIVPKALLPRANGRIEAAETVVQNFLAGPFTSAFFAVTLLIPLGLNARRVRARCWSRSGAACCRVRSAVRDRKAREARTVVPPARRRFPFHFRQPDAGHPAVPEHLHRAVLFGRDRHLRALLGRPAGTPRAAVRILPGDRRSGRTRRVAASPRLSRNDSVPGLRWRSPISSRSCRSCSSGSFRRSGWRGSPTS